MTELATTTGIQHHVIAQPSASGFIPQPGQVVIHDEAAHAIHIIEGRMVTSIHLPSSSSTRSSTTTTTTHLSMQRSLATTPTKPAGQKQQHMHSRSVSGVSAVSDNATVSSTGGVSSILIDEEGSEESRDDGFSFLASPGPPILNIRARPSSSQFSVEPTSQKSATALQRTNESIEVIDHSTGNLCVVSPAKKDAVLLGFLWSNCPGADFVLVTSRGLELYAMHPEKKQGLTLTAHHKAIDVQWFVWSPGTALLLCGCGSSGLKVRLWQLVSPALVILPLLDLSPPWGSPTKSAGSYSNTSYRTTPTAGLLSRNTPSPIKSPAVVGEKRGGNIDNNNASTTASSSAAATPNFPTPSFPSTSSPRYIPSSTNITGSGFLSSSSSANNSRMFHDGNTACIWVVRLYGGAYVVHYDILTDALRLYRVYRDATQLRYELPLARIDPVIVANNNSNQGVRSRRRVDVTVADNVLLVHLIHQQTTSSNIDQGNDDFNDGSGGVIDMKDFVFLIDIVAGSGIGDQNEVLGSPVPLGFPHCTLHIPTHTEESDNDNDIHDDKRSSNEPLSHYSPYTDNMAGWEIAPPCWAIHPSTGNVFEIVLDLVALSKSWLIKSATAANLSVGRFLEFLLRRQHRQNLTNNSSSFGIVRGQDPGVVVVGFLQQWLKQQQDDGIDEILAAFHVVNSHIAERLERSKATTRRNATGRMRSKDTRSNSSNERDGAFLQPIEFVDHVIEPVVQELLAVVNLPRLARSILVQYCRSCTDTGVQIPPKATMLLMDSYIACSQAHMIPELLLSQRSLLQQEQASGGGGDSMNELVEYVESLESSGIIPVEDQASLCLLSHLKQYHRVCRTLLAQGKVLEAMKLIEKNKVETVTPRECLEAAASTGELPVFVAVYRMCGSSVTPDMPGLVEVLEEYRSSFDEQGIEILKESLAC